MSPHMEYASCLQAEPDCGEGGIKIEEPVWCSDQEWQILIWRTEV